MTPVQVEKETAKKLKQFLDENKELTIAEIRRQAAILNISNEDARNWLLLHGAKIKASMSKVVAGKPRCKFFDELPYEKKIALLKKTRSIANVKNITSAWIQELAIELELFELPLSNWIRNKKRRDLLCARQLSDEVIEELKKEFRKCSYLDEEQALFLAYELNSSSSLIKKWFINQRFQEQKTKMLSKNKVSGGADKPKEIENKVIKEVEDENSCVVGFRGRKTNEQKNILFEAFKASPSYLSTDKMRELSKLTHLSLKQIHKWLSCIRVKWATTNEAQLKRDLTNKVKPDLLKIMEKQYKIDKFVTDDLCTEIKELGMHPFVLKGWFSKRRLYEVHSDGHGLIENENANSNANLKDAKIADKIDLDPVAQDDIKFFKNLPHSFKLRLFKASKSDNPKCEQIASDFGVPVERIREWIRNKKRRTEIRTRQSRIFTDKQLETLKKNFQESNIISKNKAIAMARKMKLRPDQIKNWFINQRRRLRKLESAEEEIEKNEVIEEIPQEVDVVSSTNSQRQYKDITQKNLLFEEFKKKPDISISRANNLEKRMRLTSHQIRKWFSNYQRVSSMQTKEKVISVIQSKAIPAEVRLKLEEEYRKSRYITQTQAEDMAKEYNLTTGQIKNWFNNARYYELFFGNAPCSRTAVSMELNTFLDDLDEQKRIRLIQELKSYPFEDGRMKSLSEELNVPLPDLNNWFEKSIKTSGSKVKKKSRHIRMTPMNQKKIQALKNEYEKNPIMTEERARDLSRRLKITMDRIRNWFDKRNMTIWTPKEEVTSEEKVVIEPDLMPVEIDSLPEPIFDTSGSAKDSPSKERSYKMPLQNNILFEEFKISPYLSAERFDKLIEQTGLLGKQITAWFQWMRQKLTTVKLNSLTEENRNKNLTPKQVRTLEREYSKNRYSNAETRETLSFKLNLSKGVLKMWFAKRRYYELLIQKSVLTELKNREMPSHIENIPIEEDSTEGVETVIVYDWECDEGEETTNKYKIEDSKESAKMRASKVFDSTILIAQAPDKNEKRSRFVSRMNRDLELIDGSIDEVLWFLKKQPSQKSEFDEEIDKEKNFFLDKQFEKNPWRTMEEIAAYSAKLKVRETLIHWWFIKKRCLLTKTVLTFKIDPVKSFSSLASTNVIDLTETDSGNVKLNTDEPEVPPQDFEFIAFNENGIKTENFVDESQQENETSLVNDNETLPVQENDTTTEANESCSEKTSTPRPKKVLNKKKKKKGLTSHQRSILMKEFKRCPYISGARARVLANDLGLTMARVDAWFDNIRNIYDKKGDAVSLTVKEKLENLSASVIEGLEIEFRISPNLSDKRMKLIAYKFKITKEMVHRWFTQKNKEIKKNAMGN